MKKQPWRKNLKKLEEGRKAIIKYYSNLLPEKDLQLIADIYWRKYVSIIKTKPTLEL